jgi:hypothetical protein
MLMVEETRTQRSCFHRASTAHRPWKQLPVGLAETGVPTMS